MFKRKLARQWFWKSHAHRYVYSEFIVNLGQVRGWNEALCAFPLATFIHANMTKGYGLHGHSINASATVPATPVASVPAGGAPHHPAPNHGAANLNTQAKAAEQHAKDLSQKLVEAMRREVELSQRIEELLLERGDPGDGNGSARMR